MRHLYVRLNVHQAGTPAENGRSAAESLRKIAERLERDGLAPWAYFQIRDGKGQPVGHAGEEEDNYPRRAS